MYECFIRTINSSVNKTETLIDWWKRMFVKDTYIIMWFIIHIMAELGLLS